MRQIPDRLAWATFLIPGAGESFSLARNRSFARLAAGLSMRIPMDGGDDRAATVSCDRVTLLAIDAIGPCGETNSIRFGSVSGAINSSGLWMHPFLMQSLASRKRRLRESRSCAQ